MTPEQFCYWLQGYCEINGKGQVPTVEAWRVIEEHVGLVFTKVTSKTNKETQAVDLAAISEELRRTREKSRDSGKEIMPPYRPIYCSSDITGPDEERERV